MTLRCREAGATAGGKTLLEGATVEFQPGRLTAILGPNGAGKSTLLSLLGGQRRPCRGAVQLDGIDLQAHAPQALALRRAVMPQESAVAFEFTAREVVELGRFPHRRRPSRHEDGIVPQAMEATGVAALAGRVLNTLSGGEKARVHLARALAQVWEARPDGAARWLLLDEPTAALDLAHQHHALRLLRGWAREEGVGVVAVLHDLNLALRYADDVVVLRNGAACRAGPAATVLEQALIARVWGVDCRSVAGADGVVQYLFG
ncbi:heme ABC transporter ATP-binding protein [Variovorax terrae]|uniref:Heme ABC transporter ATP-binding protein n=1 Tax=Variovorax terrae TaxID=2923278 RepID=A0A9X1VXC7_9BURK|nr:heme ABC transporter ATP-binding protein [Variovorax terrae]MCJ0763784.1 heme ABC transporter ATP-binding protein [Variovorax terrae]